LFLIIGGVVAAVWERSARRALLFGSAALPALAWWIVVARCVPSAGADRFFTLPLAGIVARLFTVRSYPDPSIQAILRTLDVLAVLGLLGTFVVAVLLLRVERVMAIRVAVILFLIVGCFMGAAVHMRDAYGFARPVSPLILWIWMRAAAERRWLPALPPLGMTVAVGAYLAQTSLRALERLLHR
jgi:hypothetical protein